MSPPSGATRVAVPPTEATFPRGVVKLPRCVASGHKGHKLHTDYTQRSGHTDYKQHREHADLKIHREHTDFKLHRENTAYKLHREHSDLKHQRHIFHRTSLSLQSRESSRSSVTRRSILIPSGNDQGLLPRHVEPLTPQNSLLSDNSVSRSGSPAKTDRVTQSGGGRKTASVSSNSERKSASTHKHVDFAKPHENVGDKNNHSLQQDQLPAVHPVASKEAQSNGDGIHPKSRGMSNMSEEKTKTSNKIKLRPFRWSTSVIGTSKQGHLNRPKFGEGSTKTSQKPEDQTLKSGFTFSTYDFYINHNADSWFTNGVWGQNRRSKTLDLDYGLPNRAATLADLNGAKKLFSHDNIDNMVKEWAQGAYRTRMLQTVLTSVDKDPTADGESVSPLMVHLKKISAAESLPGVFHPNRKISVPWQMRRSSVFYDLPSFEHLSEQERIRKQKLRSFRWYSHLIRAMVRLSMNMTQLSRDLTHKSAYSEFLYILAGATTHAGQEGLGTDLPGGRDKSGEPQLLFDRSWFSRGRARSRMPAWAIDVMSRPPDRRTSQQVQHLKHLLATMRSFRENMTDDMRTKMCQVVRYTKCDKGRVVLRQGHVGHDFYFIFSGSVFIQIDIYDAAHDEMKTSVENVLRMGSGFGEIALLGDGVRTASVICKEPTELCQIDKATFMAVCPALFNQQLQDKVQFARQFPLFSSWDPEELRKLCFLSQVLDVPHSTVIEANWARPDFAYFVMKGRVSMLKQFDVTDIEEKAGVNRGLLNDLDTNDVSKQQEGDEARRRHIRFANVGTLGTGTHTELSVLSNEPPKDITPIALVSEGARLLRITTRTFHRMAPRKLCEEYLRKVYQRRTFPSEEDLRELYLTGKSWSAFRASVLQTQLLGQAGALLASIPATLKGSSGWARWPGYVVITNRRQPKEEAPTFHDDYHDLHFPPGQQLLSEWHQLKNATKDNGHDYDEDDAEESDFDETGYFYSSASSESHGEDPLHRTPVRSPLDDHLDEMSLESDRSFTQEPPRSGSVSSWRKRLPKT